MRHRGGGLVSGDPLRGFDRALREYEAREPIDRCEHGVDLYQRDCAACDDPDPEDEEEPPAVFLGLVGSVGTLLFWLFLAAPQ